MGSAPQAHGRLQESPLSARGASAQPKVRLRDGGPSRDRGGDPSKAVSGSSELSTTSSPFDHTPSERTDETAQVRHAGLARVALNVAVPRESGRAVLADASPERVTAPTLAEAARVRCSALLSPASLTQSFPVATREAAVLPRSPGYHS